MKMRLSRAFYNLTGDQGSVDGFTNVTLAMFEHYPIQTKAIARPS